MKYNKGKKKKKKKKVEIFFRLLASYANNIYSNDIISKLLQYYFFDYNFTSVAFILDKNKNRRENDQSFYYFDKGRKT